MKINQNYLLLGILLFIIEVFIALFVKDDFIRPYFGDFIVVILIYCTVKAFFSIKVIKTAIGVLIFAYFIELLQFLDFIKIVGLEDIQIAKVILGTSFSWTDILHYSLGILFVLVIEKLLNKRSNRLNTEI